MWKLQTASVLVKTYKVRHVTSPRVERMNFTSKTRFTKESLKSI